MKISSYTIDYLKEQQNSGGSSSGSTTVVDNLQSNSTTSALSANQGRVLNNQLTQFAQKINKTTTSAPTALTNNKVESGKVYNITLTDADDSLTIDSWDDSGYESIIYLNVGEDVDVPISYPDTIKYIGSDFSGIESGKNYVISLLNGVFIYGEIN